jgi:hypothetical protein
MTTTDPHKKMYGVVEGVYYGQQERVDEINDRYQERQFSDFPLEPNYSPRSISTKYARFPMMNGRKPAYEQRLSYPQHSSSVNFNPGTRSAPSSGFFSNVDVETILRNQTVALQKGADQGVYVPSANSDLYKVSIVSRPSNQPNPLLFRHFQFNQTPHPNNENSVVGRDVFMNHTRTQLRGVDP